MLQEFVRISVKTESTQPATTFIAGVTKENLLIVTGVGVRVGVSSGQRVAGSSGKGLLQTAGTSTLQESQSAYVAMLSGLVEL